MRETKYIEQEKQISARNGLHLPKMGFNVCELTFLGYYYCICCNYSHIRPNMWLNKENKGS